MQGWTTSLNYGLSGREMLLPATMARQIITWWWDSIFVLAGCYDEACFVSMALAVG